MEFGPRVWAVVIDGKRLELWDLPIEQAEELATRHEVGHWTDIVDSPMATLALAKDLVELAAKKLGTGIPVVGTLRDLWVLFERVKDDLPVEFEDGLPKSVPAQVDAETIG